MFLTDFEKYEKNMGLVLNVDNVIKTGVADIEHVAVAFQACLNATRQYGEINKDAWNFKCSKINALRLFREIELIATTDTAPALVPTYAGIEIVTDNRIPDAVIYLMPK